MPHPRTIPITNPDDPRIADFRNLTDSELRRAERTGLASRCIAEGDYTVRQMLRAPGVTTSILIDEERLAADAAAPDPLLPRIPADLPVYTCPRAILQTIVGYPFHRGVLACGRHGPHADPAALAKTCRAALVLEDLTNSENVGAAFRTLAALAGVPQPGQPSPTAIFLSPGCCDPLYRKSIRVSMGLALHIPYARLDPWPDALSTLTAAGLTTIALTPDPAATDITTLTPPPRIALLLGAEGPGLTPAAMAAAALRIRIAIDPAADSLNVNTAAAIALHRLARPPHTRQPVPLPPT